MLPNYRSVLFRIRYDLILPCTTSWSEFPISTCNRCLSKARFTCDPFPGVFTVSCLNIPPNTYVSHWRYTSTQWSCQRKLTRATSLLRRSAPLSDSASAQSVSFTVLPSRSSPSGQGSPYLIQNQNNSRST